MGISHLWRGSPYLVHFSYILRPHSLTPFFAPSNMTDAPGYVTNTIFIDSGCAVTPDVLPQPAKMTGLLELGQNYPNPHIGETTVPFTITTPADVRLDILDLQGRKLAGVVRKGRSPGIQSIKLNLTGLGIPPGDYLYRLEATTKHGVFCQSKLMTTEE
jgi:hypothetical protein